MDPVFALHTALFPRQMIGLQVFEERYLRIVRVLGASAGSVDPVSSPNSADG